MAVAVPTSQSEIVPLASQTSKQKQATMTGMGLHVFYPEWQGPGRQMSTTFREVTLKLFGSDEKLTFPCQQCTKVEDVRGAVAAMALVDPINIVIMVKTGCYTRVLNSTDEVQKTLIVKGIVSFKPQKHVWAHPVGVIGSGYHGLKTLMIWAKYGHKDLVCFDRNDKVGGYCWITAANKTSKLQTEFGAFHVWWGADMMQGSCQYPGDYWGTFPRKPKILEHFQAAAEEYGILPYINFQTNVASIDVVGGKKAESRHYSLTVNDLKGGDDKTFDCSVLYNYPGSMTKNRIVEYPGEETFEGVIGYGMGDCLDVDNPYCHEVAAILGNGAFAVENARTLIENGAEKVWLITRRKNVASPRVPCWFVHQGPVPTPGALCLKMFQPMYDMCNFGDVFDFWSVTSDAKRTRAQVTQNSRFGIGDVTFLAIACGMLEYVVDTLKRLTKHCMHLTSGMKLEPVKAISKCLGLLGDFEVDRMHKMTFVHGVFCDGDWRRNIFLDATGMHAANFTTFSTGIGTTGYVRTTKYLYENPKEFYRMETQGVWDQLPKNKANEKEDKPAYVYDVMHTNTALVTLGYMAPKSGEMGATDNEYKYRMYHAAHPIDKFLKECIASWDEYQADWKARGCKAPYQQYPYTREMIEGYVEEYNKWVGMSISIDGPDPVQEAAIQKHEKPKDIVALPTWATDDKAIDQVLGSTRQDANNFWKGISGNNVLVPSTGGRGGHH